MVRAVRVFGNSPYRISTLKREKSLGNVSLDERYAACFSGERHELEVEGPGNIRVRYCSGCESAYV